MRVPLTVASRPSNRERIRRPDNVGQVAPEGKGRGDVPAPLALKSVVADAERQIEACREFRGHRFNHVVKAFGADGFGGLSAQR